MSLPFILYSNILESGTLTATSEASAIENVTDWRTYLRWEATSAADQDLTCDYGEAVSVDSFGIAGHNLGTVGAEVTLQSSATGAWAGEEVTQATASPTDNEPVLKSFTSASARYWRLKLSSLGAAPEIGVLCLGEKMEFPDYPDTPLQFMDEEVEASDGVAKGGHLLGVCTRYAPFTIEMTITYILWSWVNTTFRTFWKAHGRKLKPFFFSVNEGFFGDARFVRLPKNYKFRQVMVDAEYMDRLVVSMEGVRCDV